MNTENANQRCRGTIDRSPSGRGNGGGTLIRNQHIPMNSRIFKHRDPPGQNCIYIPPGDHRNERYRLSTFMCFQNPAISIFELAEAGFYFTGYKDRAKCFSCGVGVEGWTLEDSPFDMIWHEPDCPMAHGRELRNVESDSTQLRKTLKQIVGSSFASGNGENRSMNYQQFEISSPNSPMDVTDVTNTMRRVQINERLPNLVMATVVNQEHEEMLKSLNLHRESDRRKTYKKWPTYPTPYFPSTLAKEGFFYLGNLDRAQCFSCSGVLRNWSPNDDVKDQHRRHFSSCRMINNSDPRNVEMTLEERREADDADREKLSTLLPNGNVTEPPNPSAAEQQHLQLYLPCENPVNPHMSSLQDRIESFRNWPAGKTKSSPEQMARSGLFYLGEGDKTKCHYCNGGLQNWDYNDEPWTEHAKWFPGCEYILRQKGISFVRNLTEKHPNLNRPMIRNHISYRDIPEFQGSPSQGACSLEARNHNESTMPSMHMERPEALAAATTKRPGGDQQLQQPKRSRSNDAEDISMLHGLREMEESMTCKICRNKKSDTVLLPCGHLCVCEVCARNAKKCVICRKKVENSMKVYRA